MYSILIPTYKNPEYLKLCVGSLLENSYYKTHQLCIHINGYDKDTIEYLKSKDIHYTLSQDNIGLPKASNISINQAIHSKILSANDDMYFSKNWDYYLHQWEIELDNKFPDYIKIIGYRFCEPLQGSFLPICNAGKIIQEFNTNILKEYIKKYSSHSTRGEWLSNALFPRDILLKCRPSEDFKSKLVDIDVTLKIIYYLKNNYKNKFLIFGVNDCCVYHFGSIATKILEKQIPEPDEVPKFENKWNMTVDNAYNKVLKSEVERSIKTYNEYSKRNDMIENINIKKYPKISTYITTFNALFFQSTLEQTIRQSLYFSDEIVVVNSSNSTDGTQNLINDLKLEYPDIIKIFTYNEPDIINQETLADRRTFALRQCSGDYCIIQDDDECIHEKYAQYIKQLPIICPNTIAFRFNTIHFYRSFNHYHPYDNDWYNRKIYMIRNINNIKHGRVNADPDNYIIKKQNLDMYEPLDMYQSPTLINTPIKSYHYGWTRNDAILLYKKYIQEVQWHGTEYWNTHKFPFQLEDPSSMQKFDDIHPHYMIPIIEKESKYNTRHIKT